MLLLYSITKSKSKSMVLKCTFLLLCTMFVFIELCVEGVPHSHGSYFTGTDTRIDFNKAIKFCADQGTVLAIIRTPEEYNRAVEVCKRSPRKTCWINANDRKKEGTWADSNNVPLANMYGYGGSGRATKGRRPWNRGEPNDAGHNEDCNAIWSSAHMMYNDFPCTNNRWGVVAMCNPIVEPPLCSKSSVRQLNRKKWIWGGYYQEKPYWKNGKYYLYWNKKWKSYDVYTKLSNDYAFAYSEDLSPYSGNAKWKLMDGKGSWRSKGIRFFEFQRATCSY